MYFVDFLNIDTAFNEIIILNIKEIIDINNSLYKYSELIEYYNITYNKKVVVLETLDDVQKELTKYIEEISCGKTDHLKPYKHIYKDDYMYISANTLIQLELVKTAKEHDYFGSFFWYMNKTNTAMGRRQLKKYILNPIINEKEIYRRQNYIELLLNNPIIMYDLEESLKKIYDFERLIARVSESTITPRELEQLRKSLASIPNLKQSLDALGGEFSILNEEIDPVDDVYKMLCLSLGEDLPRSIKDSNIIKEGFNDEIDRLRSLKTNSTKWLLDLEQEQREITGIKNLKIKYNKIFGYFFEVTNSFLNKVPDNYIRKQTMANCERYITQELKIEENKILNASDMLKKLEIQVFEEIKLYVKKEMIRLQSLAHKVAFIDVMSSFAKLSKNNNLVCPKYEEKDVINIIEGFHPVVKQGLKTYINNDILMPEDVDILLITGPNMSGKSTYMRQLVLIIIMGQMGCYVPAKEAHLKIIDKIYTRIGASDDLAQGKSTFMVEMKETAEALTNATKDSLLIFDELGRGTSTYDGIALAQAIIEEVHQKIKCKTLFSTHYHELIELENNLEKLKNIHVKAKQENGELTFYHKILPGGVEKSFGIEVAKLADLSDEVIVRANQIMYQLEDNHTIFNKDTKQLENNNEQELELIKLKLERIKNLDLNKMSPIEVVNFINNFKEHL